MQKQKTTVFEIFKTKVRFSCSSYRHFSFLEKLWSIFGSFAQSFKGGQLQMDRKSVITLV